MSTVTETAGAEHPLVVLGLRSRTRLSSLAILDAHAPRLTAIGGRLILSGAAPELVKQRQRTGRADLGADVSAVATNAIADSSDEAYARRSDDLPPTSHQGEVAS